MTPFTALNREHWLTELAARMEPLFQASRLKLPSGSYRVTCGWPCKGGTGSKTYRIGECHAAKSSTGGVHELFISPRIETPAEVAGTLCHELLHVAIGVEHSHDSVFVAGCQAIGLTQGKPTSAGPGIRLAKVLERLTAELGPYPHKKLEPLGKLVKQRPPYTAKVICDCGCKFSLGLKWINAVGVPTCGCGLKMKMVEPF